jgi:hypothetical protein
MLQSGPEEDAARGCIPQSEAATILRENPPNAGCEKARPVRRYRKEMRKRLEREDY